MTHRDILNYNEDFGYTTVECDCCGEELNIDGVQWDTIKDEKEFNGWLSRKVDGEWYDFCCYECYKAFLADNN